MHSKGSKVGLGGNKVARFASDVEEKSPFGFIVTLLHHSLDIDKNIEGLKSIQVNI
jgi:hypothetical protein